MTVHALVSSVWTLPEPTIDPFLNGKQEVFTHLDHVNTNRKYLQTYYGNTKRKYVLILLNDVNANRKYS